jgi:hypothetical protein
MRMEFGVARCLATISRWLIGTFCLIKGTDKQSLVYAHVHTCIHTQTCLICLAAHTHRAERAGLADLGVCTSSMSAYVAWNGKENPAIRVNRNAKMPTPIAAHERVSVQALKSVYVHIRMHTHTHTHIRIYIKIWRDLRGWERKLSKVSFILYCKIYCTAQK